MAVEHVPGKNVGRMILYALSTCPWCRKTRKLLDDLGVEYDIVDVDLLRNEEQDRVIKEVKQWNPSCSFPTLVINDNKCIIGFKENEIRDAVRT